MLKTYVVKNVREYLEECENVIGNANRAKIAKKIYDFIFKYPLFLIKQPKFLEAVEKKLIEFTFEDPADMGDFIVFEYFMKLDEILGNTKPNKKKTKQISTKAKKNKVKINTGNSANNDDNMQNFITDASNYVIDL
jgi:hypothetical protein